MLLYELQSPSDYFITECEEKRLSSLIQCATVGHVSRAVRFFFNLIKKNLPMELFFSVYRNNRYTDGWNHYGMISFLFLTALNWNLTFGGRSSYFSI